MNKIVEILSTAHRSSTGSSPGEEPICSTDHDLIDGGRSWYYLGQHNGKKKGKKNRHERSSGFEENMCKVVFTLESDRAAERKSGCSMCVSTVGKAKDLIIIINPGLWRSQVPRLRERKDEARAFYTASREIVYIARGQKLSFAIAGARPGPDVGPRPV